MRGARPHEVARSIPGNPPARAPLPAIADAPALAIHDIAQLADTLARRRLWPMIEPVRAVAHWQASQQVLTVLMYLPVPADAPYGPLYHHNLDFRWGRLREYSDGWYDTGWHWVSSPRHVDRTAACLIGATINRRWTS